jgi:RHS repeat-associated protein
MIMPGRKYSAGTQYRYGFNGKENDNEVKGEGNSADFGARIYDTRLGRFLSVDALEKNAPSWTPYRFAADNPIFLVDEDGNFEIPIHKKITQNAARKAAKLKNLTSDQVKELTIGVQNADYYGFAKDYHFDGRKNFSEIETTWNKVNKQIQSRGSDYNNLGYDLHTVQDFYSHSNYVELYVEFYKNQGGDMSKFSADLVPLFEDGVKDAKFKEVLKKSLRTGEFELSSNEKMPWTDKSKLGKRSHYEMNKDSNESKHGKEKITGTKISFHDLAKEVAERATTEKIIGNGKKK